MRVISHNRFFSFILFIAFYDRLHPQYDQALNNLGNLYKDSGQLLEAEHLLIQAVNVR